MARQPGRATRDQRRPGGDDAPGDAPPAPDGAAPGLLVDGRYRLTRRLNAVEHRWAAVDELLDRPVEVRYLRSAPDHLGELLSASNARTDARWLRLLDAGPAGDGAWLVIEDPCRPSLLDRVRESPLDPAAAVALASATAQALRDAGEGMPADLTPDRVYVDDSGVRLDARPGETATTTAAGQAVRTVGRLLLFALTGVWTGAEAPGVASRPDAAPAPRRHRGGIPRRLDALTAGAVTGQVGSLDDLLSALAALPLAQRKGPRPGSVAARRIGAWALPPLALAIIGIVAWTVGSDLGAIPGADLSNPRLGKLPAVTSGRSPVVWRHPPRVTSFGPAGSGGDGATQAPAAVDGNLSTVWHTQTYASNRFGGLKSGVGLLIDLGRRTPVGAVQILLTHPGATLEVRSGNAPPTSAADLHLIRLARGGRLRIRVSLRHTMDTRYWLVWLTRLPRSGDGYSEGIREIRLEQPRGR